MTASCPWLMNPARCFSTSSARLRLLLCNPISSDISMNNPSRKLLSKKPIDGDRSRKNRSLSTAKKAAKRPGPKPPRQELRITAASRSNKRFGSIKRHNNKVSSSANAVDDTATA